MRADAAAILTCRFVWEGQGVRHPTLSVHHRRLQAFGDQHPESERISATTVVSPAGTSGVSNEVVVLRAPSPSGGSEF
jgi:hypothetical protein